MVLQLFLTWLPQYGNICYHTHLQKKINNNRAPWNKLKSFSAQSFASLMADYRQDINNWLHIGGDLMEHFLIGIIPLRHLYNHILIVYLSTCLYNIHGPSTQCNSWNKYADKMGMASDFSSKDKPFLCNFLIQILDGQNIKLLVFHIK